MNDKNRDNTPNLPDPEGFLSDVLRRTSGTPCERAHDLLCDYTDRSLERDAQTLLQGHLSRCTECHALAVTVEEVSRRLPAMTELYPGRFFAPAVLSATSGRRQAVRRGWESASAWVRTLMRPRFAMEAAYVGAMLIWLAVALPGSPLHGSTGLILEQARKPQMAPLAELNLPVARARQKVRTASRRVWSATGGRSLEFIESERIEFRESLANARCARRELRERGAQLGRAALELDWSGGWTAVREVPRAAGCLFDNFADADDVIAQGETSPPTTD